jgi:hypothetical protein
MKSGWQNKNLNIWLGESTLFFGVFGKALFELNNYCGEHKTDVILSEAKNPSIANASSRGAERRGDLIVPRNASQDRHGQEASR